MASRKDVVAGGASIEIRAVDYTRQVLSQVSGNLSNLGASAMRVGASLAAGAAAAAAGLTAFTVATASSAAAIDDAAKRTGASVEGLQELRHAGEQSGTSFEGIVKGLRKVNAAMSDNKAREAMEGLGLSLEALDKMSPEDRFVAIGGAIGALGDEVQRAEAAAAIFGEKVGSELMPLFDAGAAGIEDFRKEAHELGQVMNGESVSALASFDDTVAKVTGSIRGLAGTLAGQLAPYLEPIATRITEIVASVTQWMQANTGFTAAIVTTIGVVGAIGVALAGFGAALAAAGAVIGGVMGIFSALSAIVAAGPFVLVAAGVTALVAALVAAGAAVAFLIVPFVDLNAIATAFTGVLENLQAVAAQVVAWFQANFGELIQGLVDAFSNGDLTGAAEIAFLSIQMAATQCWSAILNHAGLMFSTLSGGFGKLIPGVADAMAAFDELNKATQKGLEIDLQAAMGKQAQTRADREAAAAAKELADFKAKHAGAADADFAAFLATQVAETAAPTAKAVEAAATMANSTFEAGSGTSQAGASAFMGGVSAFKKLEDETAKQTEHLAAIRRQTKDGLGAQIT